MTTPPLHRLTNRDPDTRRGDCAVCGPRVRIEEVKSSNGRSKWRCDSDTNPRRLRRLKKRGLPNITQAQIDTALEKQNGICAICLNRAATHRDHCHATDKFRGMLCHQCNVVLGLVYDDPDVLRRAATYLES